MTDFTEIEDEIVDCLAGDEPIRTTGSIQSQLIQRGVVDDCDGKGLREHLEDMRERGLIKLAHGEFGEYTVPSKK